MLVLTKLVRLQARRIAGSAAVLAASPAMASLNDIDWNSYLDWKSFGWPSWLVLGAVAMLIVGVVLRASRGTASAESGVNTRRAGDSHTRPMGTMSLYPDEHLDSKLAS